MPDLDEARATELARERLDYAAEIYRDRLESRWADALPGNHSPVETLFLAHLMTTHDGYNPVEMVDEWERLPKDGWQTSLVYLAHPARRMVFSFAFENRHGEFARQLGVIIDHDQPGERTPNKLARERQALALGFALLTFTEPEIIADPDECRERVESAISDLADEVLRDAGQIPARPEI